ncbi:MAG: helix-turn-helix domain-containing protein [Defluviitaleaceae bacterium]|nr:helix-turn-helix domain-containing protein [Defluviitaleaceae bacterium]
MRALVGTNIRRERIARNITTDELASLLGHTPSSVGLIERGDRGASAFNLFKLSKIFNVPTDQFFVESDANEKPQKKHVREKLDSLISDFNEEELACIVNIVKAVRDLKEKD